MNKPNENMIREFIESQSKQEFTYSAIGATRHEDYSTGFIVDHNRIRLGTGRATFENAKQALIEWKQFRLGWVELHRSEDPPEPGQTVAVLARAAGLWVLNACRIVYLIEEEKPIQRFALGYGTLPDHAKCGEERFQVEWNPDDDSVWYDIFAFSHSNQLLSRLAYPYVRTKQKQFARDSKQAMKTAVANLVSGQ